MGTGSAKPLTTALADLGGIPGACPPQGSRFFRFDIQNFQKVATSGVHAPSYSYEVHAPLREILDPALHSPFRSDLLVMAYKDTKLNEDICRYCSRDRSLAISSRAPYPLTPQVQNRNSKKNYNHWFYPDLRPKGLI